jgi:hypothetical protein
MVVKIVAQDVMVALVDVMEHAKADAIVHAKVLATRHVEAVVEL